MININKIVTIFSLLIILVLNDDVDCDSKTTAGSRIRTLMVKNDPPLNKSNKKILQIKSIPGYPGSRSDVYEILMEPYYFYIEKKGVAEIKSYDEEEILVNGPEGKLMFQQLPEGLRINGTITGLPFGIYKLHINERGLLSKGCKSSGGNYNPYKVDHLTLDPLEDIGDLVEFEAEDKITQINVLSKYLTLTGANGVIGRAVVVENAQDSYQSFPVCGIIGVA
ncbi:GSCOCG00009942001-RA-CDS [Cotesia congregata]|nr:GSCOCG00009942001-RA-CDS [Cotesia congregata]